MTEKILQEAANEFIEAIKAEMRDKDLNASGAGSDSLSAKIEGQKITIEGYVRLLFLVDGRAPGKKPPLEPILNWVEVKLNVPPEEAKGVAFAIMEKISREGTDIFTDKAKGLQIELIINDLYNQLSEKIFNFEANVLMDQIAAQYGSN